MLTKLHFIDADSLSSSLYLQSR